MNPDIVLDKLRELDIAYTQHHHPEVATIDEAKQYWSDIQGMHCKNLFLRDNKGRKHYLLCVEADKHVDLKALSASMGERLGFASPKRLMKYLGLKPGSVSPFGLMNDNDSHVQVMLDGEMNSSALVNFHPNVNTSTLSISPAGLEKFIQHCGNSFRYVEL